MKDLKHRRSNVKIWWTRLRSESSWIGIRRQRKRRDERKARMNEKMNRKGTGRGIVLVATVLIIYTIICYIIIDRNPGKEVEVNENSQKELVAVTLDHMTTLPLPASDSSVEWECGTFYNNISKKNMEAYLRRLSDAGWKDYSGKEFSIVIPSGTTEYELVNGDHMLQLITYFEDEGVAFYNSILVYYDNDISVSEWNARRGAVTKEEVLPLIQHQVEELSLQGKIPDNKDKVTGMFEIYIDQGYDKLKLQAFAAYSDLGFTGCFLVRNGIVTYVPGNLANSHVLDIDHDGTYEIIDAYDSWQGNTFKLELLAYEYVNPPTAGSLTEVLKQKYYTCFVPADGYDAYRLNMDRTETVTLIGETKDYGKVQIVNENFAIIGDEAESFLTWSEDFDQSRLSQIEKILPETPPLIDISMENRKLDYIICLSDWDGRTEPTEVSKLAEAFDENYPTTPLISLVTMAVNESAPRITIDFKEYMPDSIRVYDAMLTEKNTLRYNINTEQAVQIIDDSRVSIPLSQHFAYYLSSDSNDYDKEWRRLFQVVCKWKDKECIYAFLLNTKGKSLNGNE